MMITRARRVHHPPFESRARSKVEWHCGAPEDSTKTSHTGTIARSTMRRHATVGLSTVEGTRRVGLDSHPLPDCSTHPQGLKRRVQIASLCRNIRLCLHTFVRLETCFFVRPLSYIPGYRSLQNRAKKGVKLTTPARKWGARA